MTKCTRADAVKPAPTAIPARTATRDDAAGTRKQPQPSNPIWDDGNNQHHRDEKIEHGRAVILYQVYANDPNKQKHHD